jgi:hypothetical protein
MTNSVIATMERVEAAKDQAARTAHTELPGDIYDTAAKRTFLA